MNTNYIRSVVCAAVENWAKEREIPLNRPYQVQYHSLSEGLTQEMVEKLLESSREGLEFEPKYSYFDGVLEYDGDDVYLEFCILVGVQCRHYTKVLIHYNQFNEYGGSADVFVVKS